MLVVRQYLKDFFVLLFVIVMGLALIISIYENIDKLGDFKPYDPAASQLFMYWIYTIPRYVLFLLPVGSLLSGMFTVGHASRNLELVAYMAAGGRLRRFLMPFALTGVFISMFAFFLGEVVVPACAARVTEVENNIIRMDSVAQRQVNGITWLRADDGSIVKLDIYIPSKDSFRGVTVFSASGNRINRIISAAEAKYIEEEEGWLLKKVVDYTPASGEMKRMDKMIWKELGPHNAFLKQVKRPFHMNYFELSQYLKRLKSMGFVNVRLDVELYSKLSYPLVNMIVLLLGVSFAARRNVGGLFAATFSLMFALAYWFGHTMLLTMGYAGILHPMIAVWLMPVVFGVIAVQQFMGVPE